MICFVFVIKLMVVVFEFNGLSIRLPIQRLNNDN